MTYEQIRKYFKKKLLPFNTKPYEIGKCYDLGPVGCIEKQIEGLRSKGISSGSIVPFFYLKTAGTKKNLIIELKSEKIVISG